MTILQRSIIKLFTFLGGIYFVIEFIAPEGYITDSKTHELITNGFIITGAVAFAVGLISIFLFHGRKVLFRRSGWFPSLVLIVFTLLMLFISGYDWLASEQITKKTDKLQLLSNFSDYLQTHQGEKFNNLTWADRVQKCLEATKSAMSEISIIGQGNVDKSLLTEITSVSNSISVDLKNNNEQAAVADLKKLSENLNSLSVNLISQLQSSYQNSTLNKIYQLFIGGIYNSLATSMFSVLAFFMATAAFRAFRIKSFESALMIITATAVILGQTPFGIHIWEGFPTLRLWLLQVPSTAAVRAIKIGTAVAGLILAFRMWFSIEEDIA